MKIWKFNDNVNTDLILPGRYALTTDARRLANAAFIEYRPEFAKEVKEGDVIVAGKNFGCGSSRETAPLALKSTGIAAIIAESYARIFFRNAINIGLVVLVSNEAKEIDETDDIELNLIKGEIKNLTKESVIKTEKLPNFVMKIVNSGGLVNYLKENGGRYEQ